MSDNHDLLNDKDVCSFEEHEAENVCSNKDAVALRDGCFAFQGRNRLEESAGGVLVGGYGYVRLPEGCNL